MDMSSIAKKYIDAVQGGRIESAVLMKLPELVNCNDWAKVEILGKLDYVSERTKVAYNGVLVKNAGGLYYIKKSLVTALEKLDKRFAKVNTPIQVVD